MRMNSLGAWILAEIEYMLWKVRFYEYCTPCDDISKWWSRKHRKHHCGATISPELYEALRNMQKDL